MNIGIYSGSFNPIHIGHLALANYLCEYAELDEVWFLVTPRNPFKANATDLLPDSLRLEMVRLATADYPRFRVNDIELRMPQPNYTIRTMDALHEQYPDDVFTLVIGADNWQCFTGWHEYERLLSDYRLLIYPRPGYPVDAANLPSSVHLATDAPLIDVSSTFIRESYKAGHPVPCFMHPAVASMMSDSLFNAH